MRIPGCSRRSTSAFALARAISVHIFLGSGSRMAFSSMSGEAVENWGRGSGGARQGAKKRGWAGLLVSSGLLESFDRASDGEHTLFDTGTWKQRSSLSCSGQIDSERYPCKFLSERYHRSCKRTTKNGIRLSHHRLDKPAISFSSYETG